MIITSIRFFDYILLLITGNLFFIWGKRKYSRQPSRMVFLELPGLRKQLETWLIKNWNSGLHNANQLLAYTLQFIPVVKAINTVLTSTPAEILLKRTAALTDQPFDWKLILYGSASLENDLRQKNIPWYFLLLGRWKRGWKLLFPVGLRLDTPARAAYAGFWYWHKHKMNKAIEAFAMVKDLPHGPELYGIAQSVVQGQAVTDLETIAVWGQENNWLDTLPSPVLRPGTVEVLRTLTSIANEARAAYYSEAPLNRATAIGRANAALALLIDSGETFCQQPEWPLIKEIAEKWRIILNKACSVGTEEVRH